MVKIIPDYPAKVENMLKPTIERMIIESGDTGLTIREIEKATSFKYNSVRSTLWTLGKHGKVVQRDDCWFPVGSTTSVDK